MRKQLVASFLAFSTHHIENARIHDHLAPGRRAARPAPSRQVHPRPREIARRAPGVYVGDGGLLPPDAQLSFYRTAAGAELDLLVERGSRRLGFEIKFSSAPRVSRGFWQACDDLELEQACVVAPVEQGWEMKSATPCQVQVLGPMQLQATLQAAL